jgi:hypothetical protein
MKTRLLLLTLLFAVITYAQVPTDYTKKYSFTNGSTINEAGASYNLITNTGFGTPTYVADRFGNANSAADLNNGHYDMGVFPDRSGYDGNQFSLSFWIKTTDAGNLFNQYNNGQDEGWIIALFNNSLGFLTGYYCSGGFSCGSFPDNQYVSTNLLDDNWHHIVAIVSKENDGTDQQYIKQMYIDNVLVVNTVLTTVPFNGTQQVGMFDVNDTTTALTGGQTGNDRYDGLLDDIKYYERKLTNAEVNELFLENKIVNIPDVNFKSDLLANNLINTNSDSEIQLIEALNFTGAINVSNLNIASLTGIEAFVNITGLNVSNNQINGLRLNANTALTSLDVSNNDISLFDLQNGNNTAIVSYNSLNNPNLTCVNVDDVNFSNTNWTNKDSQTNFSTSCAIPIFVDVNATGNNDGSSWANALTDFTLALANNPEAEFWIKSGTYTAGASRTDSFVLNLNQKIYGGFNGTESVLSDRNVNANPTILSGDINGNDAVTFNATDPNRAENSYRIINVNGNGVFIDGLIITSANANQSGGIEEGSGINVDGAYNVTISNCQFTKHTLNRAGVIRNLDNGNNYTVTVNNSIFKDNQSIFATCYYGRASGGNMSLRFDNTLFTNNTATTNSGASMIWLRQDAVGSQTLDITNSTFADNIMNSATPVITYLSNVPSVNIYNSIFWNNTNGSGTLVDALQSGASGVISNNLSNNGFTSYGSASNILTGDPLFVDAANEDFRLGSGSPAIDSGANNFVNTTEDLDGNQRIFNTTVDMGAYEFGSTLGTTDYRVKTSNIKIYPNPVNETLNILLETEINSVEIYNLLGAKILSETSKQINVSQLQSGVYLIKIKTASNETMTKRFIK